MINGELELVERPQQSYLSAENIKRLLQVVQEGLEIPQLSRWVGKEEIEEHDFNLAMNRYVRTTPPAEPIDLDDIYQKLGVLKAEEAEQLAGLEALMRELEL